MGLFESSVASVLNSDTPFLKSYERQQEAEQRKAATAITRTNTAVDNMLARPDLVDSRAAMLANQFSTTLAKPKFAKFANKTDAVDAAAGDDSPMSGAATKIKDVLSRHLSNSMNTGKSLAQIENEAVQAVITPELVNKAHEHQFKKDTSFGNAFGIFGGSKSGTKPLPGYEDWRENKRAEGKKEALQFDIFSGEGVKEGAIGGVTMAGFAAALAGGAAVLGSAPVSVPAILTAAAVSGLAAIPATLAARKVQSIAENSDWQAANPDSIAPHVAGGIVGALGGGGLARVGLNAVKNAGIKKMSSEAAEAFIASTKGKLANATVNVGTVGGATAGGALGAAEPGLALDLVTFVAAEQAVMKGGKIALTKMIENSMLSENAMKVIVANPTGKTIVDNIKQVRATEDIALATAEAMNKENVLATVRRAEKQAFEDEVATAANETRLARPQFDEAGTATYLAGEGLVSDVTNRVETKVVGKGKQAKTVEVGKLGNNEDDLIVRGLREKGIIEDAESFTAKVTTELSDVGFTKTLNPETATLKTGTLDEKLAVELQVEEIANRNSISAAENRLLQVQGDLLSTVGPKGNSFNPTAQMESLKARNNAYGDVDQLDVVMLNEDLKAVGSGTLGKHVQGLLEGQTGKFDKIKATTYKKEREDWKAKYGITAAGIAGLSVLGVADDSEASMLSTLGKVVTGGATHIKIPFTSVAKEGAELTVPKVVAENLSHVQDTQGIGRRLVVENLLAKLKIFTPAEVKTQRLVRVDGANIGEHAGLTKSYKDAERIAAVDATERSPKVADFSTSELATSSETWKPHGKFWADNAQDATVLRGTMELNGPQSYTKHTSTEIKKAAEAHSDANVYSYARPHEAVVASIEEQELKKFMRSEFSNNSTTHKDQITGMLKDAGITHLKLENVDGYAGTSEIIQITEKVSKVRGRLGDMLYSNPVTAAVITAGGASSMTVPFVQGESKEVYNERAEGTEAGAAVLDAVFGALANNPLVNLLGGSEAHAGTAQTIAKAGLTIPKVLEEYFTAAFGKGTKALQAVVDGGFVGKPLQKNALTMRGTLPARDFSTVPNKEVLEKVLGDAADVAGSGAMTPMGRANLVARSVVTGEGVEKVTVGLAPVELAQKMTEAQNNTAKAHEVLANLERIFDVKMGGDSVTKATLEHMKPIQDATSTVFAKQQVLEHSLVELTKQERMFAKLLKDGKINDKEGNSIKALLDDVVGSKEKILVEVEASKPYVLKATEDIQVAYKELAAKNVRTRLSLAAEDTADYKRYPFLKNMLSENEKQYVEGYKDLMKHYSERIEEAGGKSIKSEFFVHHSLQKTEAFTAGNEELRKMLADFNIPNADVVLANSKFHSRTKFSHNFVPDIKYNSAEYIADAERRIAGMKFWKVGSDDGWDAVRKSSIALNSKKITSFFQALDDGMRPIESTFMNKAADNYSKLEVIRLLGGSVSAPFKHLLKLQADAATYGVVNTLGTIPEALSVAGRNFVRNQVGKLVDAKFVSPEFGSKLWSGSKEMDHVVQSMTSQKNMINYLSEIEQGMGSPYRNLASKFVDGLSDAAGFGIKAVESFDRTLTVLAAAKMAQKNGMTAQQAIYGSYETMLLNNFMGGALNSAWGRNPKVRAAMLFQNTPFKIWERRLVAAINAGKDLQTTFGKIKNGDLEKEWVALQKIKGDMKEGEYKFKAGILFDSLTASRNAFGNSSSGILVKELMGVGAIMYGSAEIFGTDMAPQFLHLPFVKTEGGTAELSTSPLIQATLKTSAGKKPDIVDDTEWDEENKPFFMSTFYNHWKGTSGYSLFASKMGRISENDIPEMYGSSVGKYLFALKNKEH